MIDFQGKKGVVMGVANQRSIAASVARELGALGAELCLTYGPDDKGRFERNVTELAGEVNATQVIPVDARVDEDIVSCFKRLGETWGQVDFVLHSVAYADRKDLEQPFSQTQRDGWARAQEISAYSFVAVAREAAPLLQAAGGGSLVGMTFIGAALAVPYYNVMGPAKAALEASARYLAREMGPHNIRCNCVSAGALRTLSSSGIKSFGDMLKVAGEHSALQRNVTLDEVARATVFLLSDASSGITGQSIYVDCGYNIMAN